MKKVLAFLAVAGILVGGWFISKAVYVGQQAGRVFEKTFDADNMVYNYEWFKQQYQDIKAADTKISNLENQRDQFVVAAGPRDKWTFEDKQQYNYFSTVLVGLQGQRSQMVADYNARAQMANRDIFRTGDLPQRI